MRAPDFTVPVYGGDAFTLSEHRGPGCHCEFLGHLVYPLLRGASLL